MKLNATPRHYMPLSQNQSDDDESGPGKEDKCDKMIFKNSYDASDCLAKSIGESESEVCTKTLPMSPLRIILFILSLILCVLFVVVFVFFLPCTIPNNLNGTCRLTNKWKAVFLNMSFTSSLNFISKKHTRNGVIIFGYENEGSGLIGIDGSNGKELWRLPLHGIPSSCVCNIDINSDGKPECLVVGSNGLFTAVDVIKGQSLWYLHNHSDLNTADEIYGEMAISDCDGDGISDVVVSYNISIETMSFYLAVVSGGTGKVVGTLLELPQCIGPVRSRFSWKSGNGTDFVLYCEGIKFGNLWLLSSKSICDAALNKSASLSMKQIFKIPHFTTHVCFYEVSDVDNQIVIVLDGVRFMLLQRTFSEFHIVWKTYLKTDEGMRIVTDGKFVQGYPQLLLHSSNITHSKVVGVSLKDGKEVWGFTLNQTVVSAVKLIKFFGRTDGLVLKSLSEYSQEKNLKNVTVPTIEEYNSKRHKVFQENYLLVKCGSSPILKTISSENISSFCEGVSCIPDIYTSNATVLVAAAGLDTSFDMLTLSTTLNEDYGTLKPMQAVVVKYFNLENVLALPRCVG